ncbi:hypothetical protein FRX31_009246, partial [Thalictrum thalictroides]
MVCAVNSDIMDCGKHRETWGNPMLQHHLVQLIFRWPAVFPFLPVKPVANLQMLSELITPGQARLCIFMSSAPISGVDDSKPNNSHGNSYHILHQ